MRARQGVGRTREDDGGEVWRRGLARLVCREAVTVLIWLQHALLARNTPQEPEKDLQLDAIGSCFVWLLAKSILPGPSSEDALFTTHLGPFQTLWLPVQQTGHAVHIHSQPQANGFAVCAAIVSSTLLVTP